MIVERAVVGRERRSLGKAIDRADSRGRLKRRVHVRAGRTVDCGFVVVDPCEEQLQTVGRDRRRVLQRGRIDVVKNLPTALRSPKPRFLTFRNGQVR